jgi:hypothetical protein
VPATKEWVLSINDNDASLKNILDPLDEDNYFWFGITI